MLQIVRVCLTCQVLFVFMKEHRISKWAKQATTTTKQHTNKPTCLLLRIRDLLLLHDTHPMLLACRRWCRLLSQHYVIFRMCDHEWGVRNQNVWECAPQKSDSEGPLVLCMLCETRNKHPFLNPINCRGLEASCSLEKKKRFCSYLSACTSSISWASFVRFISQ